VKFFWPRVWLWCCFGCLKWDAWLYTVDFTMKLSYKSDTLSRTLDFTISFFWPRVWLWCCFGCLKWDAWLYTVNFTTKLFYKSDTSSRTLDFTISFHFLGCSTHEHCHCQGSNRYIAPISD
jgi:hypothetical protein